MKANEKHRPIGTLRRNPEQRREVYTVLLAYALSRGLHWTPRPDNITIGPEGLRFRLYQPDDPDEVTIEWVNVCRYSGHRTWVEYGEHRLWAYHRVFSIHTTLAHFRKRIARRYTEEQIYDIRHGRYAHLSTYQVARLFSVHHSGIHRIRTYEMYSDLP